jgi:lysophospholipase L1-like esterase
MGVPHIRTAVVLAVSVAVSAVVSLRRAVAAATTKIACVGASTTSGDGSTAGHHYPDELQRLEGTAAEVKNFGVSGTTMLRAVSASYWNTPQFTQALAYQPDVTIIWFGGNDAKPENWTAHKGEFLGDYEAMIRMFQALPSHPRTYVVLSLLTRDTEGIPKAVVDNEVIPLCRQAAAETGSGIVDVHDDLAGHPEYFPDGIHPNDMGTLAVAKLVFAALNDAPDGGVLDGPDDRSAPALDAVVAEAAATPAEAGGGAAPPQPPPPSDASAGLDAAAQAGSSVGGAGGASAGGGMLKAGGAHGGGCAAGGGAAASPVGLLLVLFAFARTSRRRAPKGGQP